MTGDVTFDVNRPSTILAIALLASIAPAAVVIGPLIVGSLVTDLGFSAQQAGYVIAGELIGAGVATFPILMAVSKVNWRLIFYIALGVVAAGNLLSPVFTDFVPLLILRFIVGLAVGATMTMTLVVVGMTANQERVFGFWSLGQVGFSVLAFAILPHVFPIVGIKGFYIGMAVIMAAMLSVVRLMPPEGTSEHKQGFKGLPPEAKKLAPIGLLALLLYYIGIGGVWAYVERIGNAAGFEATYIGYVLSIASIIGVAGASTATYFSARFGRLSPSTGGYLLLAISMFMLFGLISENMFAASAFMFKYAWWFLTPYLLANMTLLDKSGSLIILTNFVIGVGLGLGPALSAFILSMTQTGSEGVLDFSPVIGMGIGCLVVSFILLLPVIRANSGKQIETV